ncbi:uncharacterized protein BO96DRAFT_457180 [Aspergillus niger CBS 101883]|uniref:uncharacterized protein n=1 Tax=Aspergillus lacticoffeatus (strain CBS 101883) TaxID=1450533 RepID=UPI000D805808|nr:uncharacterized protein BO96DRAFT_457180 [Aspergillus niger CBS 101883]PYH55784.1 hypothetical protein BO96DRAFT_457180 [Aspergillus niger CBS 101883]
MESSQVLSLSRRAVAIAMPLWARDDSDSSSGEKPVSNFLKSGVPGIIVGIFFLIAVSVCCYFLYRNKKRDAKEAAAPLFNFSFLSGLWSLGGFGSSYTSIIVLDKISLSVARASLSTGPPSYVSHGTSQMKSTERINEHMYHQSYVSALFDVLARGLPNLPCITIQLRLAPLGRYLTWDGRATSTHQLLSDPL